MICKNCNLSIPDHAAFCPLCGTETGVTIAGKPESKKCPQCGTENPLEAKFCRVDGWRFPPKKVETKSDADQTRVGEKRCVTCGTFHPSTARFCGKDGSPLETDSDVRGNIAEDKVHKNILGVAKEGAQEIKGDKQWFRRRWIYLTPLFILLLAVVYGVFSEAVNNKKSQQNKAAEAVMERSRPAIDLPRLEGQMNKALRIEGLDGVTAEVDEAAGVTLKGVVKGSQDKKKAFKIAKSFKEVRQIKDIIFVIEP
jgi:ribosomal protein L40E